MKNYNEMSCSELKRGLDQIDSDLRNFPNMSQVEKDRLTYKRMRVNGALLHKVAAMLDECDKEA